MAYLQSDGPRKVLSMYDRLPYSGIDQRRAEVLAIIRLPKANGRLFGQVYEKQGSPHEPQPVQSLPKQLI